MNLLKLQEIIIKSDKFFDSFITYRFFIKFDSVHILPLSFHFRFNILIKQVLSYIC